MAHIEQNKLTRLTHVWLSIVENPYFSNLVNFIKYKFDTEEFDNTIILIGREYAPIIKEYRVKFPEKKIVIYNWEQLCSSNEWVNVSYVCNEFHLADEVWDYCELNALYLKKYHDITVAHVYKFEYYPSIECLENVDPDIDVLFYGLMNERRANILANIQLVTYNAFSLVCALGYSVEKTNSYIQRSKIVLNIHAFEPWSRQEQERIAFLLGNKKCVLSETSQENYFCNAIIESPVNNFIGTIKDLLKDDKWKTVAETGYSLFKENKCIKLENN